MTEITRADIKSMLGAISSASVAEQIVRHLSAVFTFAVKEEVVANNPCKMIAGSEPPAITAIADGPSRSLEKATRR